MRTSKAPAGIGLLATLLVQGAAAGSSCCNQIISRDVVVVGGGAAGAHAAVWLRDNGKSVVVVEKASQLVSYCLHLSLLCCFYYILLVFGGLR